MKTVSFTPSFSLGALNELKSENRFNGLWSEIIGALHEHCKPLKRFRAYGLRGPQAKALG